MVRAVEAGSAVAVGGSAEDLAAESAEAGPTAAAMEAGEALVTAVAFEDSRAPRAREAAVARLAAVEWAVAGALARR